MDANRTYGTKAWRQLHKNAASNIEQILGQHPTKQQLYGHLSPITKSIQVRRTIHAGHCWRSKFKLICDILIWTPLHGRAKAGRLARTYTQLCTDTGYGLVDLPGAMDDRDGWREMIREINSYNATNYIYC